jgi:hypothetical protein
LAERTTYSPYFDQEPYLLLLVVLPMREVEQDEGRYEPLFYAAFETYAEKFK